MPLKAVITGITGQNGVKHSVRELVDVAFARVGLDPARYVHIDSSLLRPAEVNHLCGNSAKARAKLGWRPKVDFRQLVEMMVDADLERVRREVATGERVQAPSAVQIS